MQAASWLEGNEPGLPSIASRRSAHHGRGRCGTPWEPTDKPSHATRKADPARGSSGLVDSSCEDIDWDAAGPSMGSPRGRRGEASANSESQELVSSGLRPYQIRKDTRKGVYVPIDGGPAELRTTALHDVAGIVATQCVAVHSCPTDRRPWDRHDGVEHSVSTASANAAMPTAPYPASSHRRRTASAWTLVWRLRARCRKRRSAAPPPRQ